ncbi:MAG: DNA mismatch repair endonuclease MutL [Alphaproteobacteria bacterium]|nr:DNA mismatch repair endonuclease MutL [Alphaproteobacteria bacterium]
MIRLLPPHLINQISAGEVIERPSSALKELIENAIDAEAKNIEITLIEGGKRLLSISDDGKGMNKEELFLSVERHATSKLPTDDLFNINFLGFRGEALASIGAVSHLKITTKAEAEETGLSLEVNAGKKSEITPTAHAKGTLIQMRDLFYNLPARLKFLKSDISELLASKEVIYKIALAYPEVSFTLFNEKKKLFFFPKAPSLKERARDIIDASFMENTLDIKATRDGMSLKGFISIPTYTRATSKDQYFIVNGRAIKDKMLYGILKAAYQGLLFQGRFPIAVLYLDIPHQEIDMNVHPAKTEVRFQKEASV